MERNRLPEKPKNILYFVFIIETSKCISLSPNEWEKEKMCNKLGCYFIFLQCVCVCVRCNFIFECFGLDALTYAPASKASREVKKKLTHT